TISLIAAEPTANIIQNTTQQVNDFTSSVKSNETVQEITKQTEFIQNKADEVTKTFQDNFKKEVLNQANTLKDSVLKSDMIKEIQNLTDVTAINDTLEKYGNMGVK
ncbi:MAG: hypothetical protein QG567_1510, partial [Campylobacterota bacterium]|nr:hypothetical protein [Campylobacterota bacterium]